MVGTIAWVGLDVHCSLGLSGAIPRRLSRRAAGWTGPAPVAGSAPGQVDSVRDQPFVGGDAEQRNGSRPVLGDVWSARLGDLGASIPVGRATRRPPLPPDCAAPAARCP